MLKGISLRSPRPDLAEIRTYPSFFYSFLPYFILQELRSFKKKKSSPKGNDAHLRATIQSEKKWKDQFFRRLWAANSVVCGQIWPNFKLIEFLCMSSLPVSMKRIPSRTTEKKWQHRFSNYNTICCHGNQSSDLAKFLTHPSFYA